MEPTNSNLSLYADFQPALNSFGLAEAVADIHQTIRTILETPKGTAALYPTFGSDIHKYLDFPNNIVTPHVVRETILALEEWEPRIEIVEVRVAFADTAHLRLKVHWRLKTSGIENTTFLELDRG